MVDAVTTLAQSEGSALDPVYRGNAFASLFGFRDAFGLEAPIAH